MTSHSLLNDYDLTLFQMSLTRSHRVTWLVAELGIIDRINVQHVALPEGTQYSPKFKSLNKMSAVPTLLIKHKTTHQQTALTESAAICMFLTDHIKGGAQFKPHPSNLFASAAYAKFVVFAAASMDPLLWAIRTHKDLLPESRRVPAVAITARKEFVQKVVPALEEALGKDAQYLCEPYHEGFTTADVMVGYALYWAQELYGLLNDSQVLREYLRRLVEREEFKRALALKPPTMKL